MEIGYEFDKNEFPPSQKAISQCLRIRNLLYTKGIYPFRCVSLDNGEGIMIYYKHNNFRITFDIDNDGDVAYIEDVNGDYKISDIPKEAFEQTVLEIFWISNVV